MIYYIVSAETGEPVLDHIRRVMIFPRQAAAVRFLDRYGLDYSGYEILEAEKLEDLPA